MWICEDSDTFCCCLVDLLGLIHVMFDRQSVIISDIFKLDLPLFFCSLNPEPFTQARTLKLLVKEDILRADVS